MKASYNFYGIIKNNNMIWNTSIPLVKESLKKLEKLKKTRIFFIKIILKLKIKVLIYIILF